MTNQHGIIEITKDDVVTVNNERVDGSYKHGDASIAGTEYTFYAYEKITNAEGTITYFEKNDILATFTFNKKGIATIKITNTETRANLRINGTKLEGIPLGTYGLKETKTAERICYR